MTKAYTWNQTIHGTLWEFVEGLIDVAASKMN